MFLFSPSVCMLYISLFFVSLVLRLALYSIYFFVYYVISSIWSKAATFTTGFHPESTIRSRSLHSVHFYYYVKICKIMCFLWLNVASFFFLQYFMWTDWGCHFQLLFPSFCLLFFLCVFFCSSVCQVRLCCIPRCFPLYNIWEKIRKSKEKKNIWLIFHCS